MVNAIPRWELIADEISRGMRFFILQHSDIKTFWKGLGKPSILNSSQLNMLPLLLFHTWGLCWLTIFSTADLPDEIFVIEAIKGHRPVNQSVKQYTKGPAVNLKHRDNACEAQECWSPPFSMPLAPQEQHHIQLCLLMGKPESNICLSTGKANESKWRQLENFQYGRDPSEPTCAITLAWRLTLKNIIIKDNPIPPSYLWASVRSSINYFRGSIQWASTKGLQKFVFVIKVGESKISNLQTESHKAPVVLTVS